MLGTHSSLKCYSIMSFFLSLLEDILLSLTCLLLCLQGCFPDARFYAVFRMLNDMVHVQQKRFSAVVFFTNHSTYLCFEIWNTLQKRLRYGRMLYLKYRFCYIKTVDKPGRFNFVKFYLEVIPS